MSGGQRRSNESQKTTLGSQGIYYNRQSDAPKKVNLLFLRGMLKRCHVEDADVEVRCTVPSQIRATATLRTEEPFV